MPEEATETTTTETQTETRDVSTEETPDKLKSALESERKLKREAERERNELRKYKEQQEQARLTEAEKLAAREKAAAEKEQALTQRERTIAVRDGLASAAAAEKLGLVASSATVIRLLDLDAVEFDETGTPTNLGRLLKQLARDEPALFTQQRRTGSADGGASGTVTANDDMNARLRAAAGRA